MEKLLDELDAFERQLKCQINHISSTTNNSNNNLKETLQKYHQQKQALIQSHNQLLGTREKYQQLMHEKQALLHQFGSKLNAKCLEAIESNSTPLVRKLELLNWMVVLDESSDKEVFLRRKSLESEFIEATSKRLEWKADENSVRLELLFLKGEKPFEKAEIFIQPLILKKLQAAIQKFLHSKGGIKVQIESHPHPSLTLSASSDDEKENVENFAIEEIQSIKFNKEIEKIQNFIFEHFCISCDLTSHLLCESSSFPEEDFIRKARNLLFFKESTSLATWTLQIKEEEEGKLHSSKAFLLPSSLSLLQTAIGKLCMPKKHLVRSSFKEFLELCESVENLSPSLIFACVWGYFCPPQSATTINADLESSCYLFNEGQALLEFLIPLCNLEEHFEVLASLHQKSLAPLRACLGGIGDGQEAFSISALRELYFSKLSLWIKNDYREAIVADLLVDYHNAHLMMMSQVNDNNVQHHWKREFEAFLQEAPGLVPFLDVKKRGI